MFGLGGKICASGIGGVIALALLASLGGCGNASSASPAVATIDLKSPGLKANGELKPDVRCGWGSLWVPLEWGKVPEGTKELALYLGRFKYVNEHGERKPVVQFADLVSKFKPTEHRLAANVLPEGVRWSYFGTNCVIPQGGQHLLLEVFALGQVGERKITRPLATRLTEEALAHPNSIESAQPPGRPLQDATAVGRLITGYTTGPHY